MKKRTIVFVFVLTFILMGSLLFPKTEVDARVAKYDAFFKECQAKQMFNGNVLVVEKGKVIYNRAIGISAINPVKPLKLDSQFRLASVTKQFTAMAIMILQERGKLNYKDNIQKYLPKLPYKGITIHHLLTHTSGLPDYMDLFQKYWDVEKKSFQEKKPANNDDMIHLLAKHHPAVHFKPGEKWEYSNTAYVILASIVTRAAKEPFEKFLHNNIFKPLNMTRSLIYSPIRDDKMEDRVYGYRVSLEDSSYLPHDYHCLNGMAGDGALYSTTGDLYKWDRALYTEKLVSRKTLELAFTPVTLNDGETRPYGYGWGIQKSQSGKKSVRHGGGWVAFGTYIARDIEEDTCFIFLTNHSTLYFRDIRSAIENILHGKAYTLPKVPIALVVGKTLLKKGIQAAVEQYKQLKKTDSGKYSFGQYQLMMLGERLIELKKLAKAIEILKFNVSLDPKNPVIHNSLAGAYKSNGNTKLALATYKEALKIDPNDPQAKAGLKQLTKK